MAEAPRRRIMVEIKIDADSWRDVRAAFRSFEADIVMHGKLSTNCISGGYSSGWILASSEDETITHESWEAELDAYLASLEDTHNGYDRRRTHRSP